MQQRVLIIGGTTGLGNSIALTFYKQHYDVIVTGIETPIIQKINQQQDSNYIAYHLDGLSHQSTDVLQNIVTNQGDIDIIIFCAGIGNLNKDQNHVIQNQANQLNVITFTAVADWSYRYFITQQSGHFAGVTSLAGMHGYQQAPAYHAAKAYQINYLQSLRHKSYKTHPYITITDIRPGFIDTPMSEDKKRFWTTDPIIAGKQIVSAIQQHKKIAYISKKWCIIGYAIQCLPSWLLCKIS